MMCSFKKKGMEYGTKEYEIPYVHRESENEKPHTSGNNKNLIFSNELKGYVT